MKHEVQAAERTLSDAPLPTEFTATVTAIREMARVDGRQVWQIALDGSAFQPEPGRDRGTLTAVSRSGRSLEVSVSAVERDSAGELWHTTAKPLQEGTEVRGRVCG